MERSESFSWLEFPSILGIVHIVSVPLLGQKDLYPTSSYFSLKAAEVKVEGLEEGIWGIWEESEWLHASKQSMFAFHFV